MARTDNPLKQLITTFITDFAAWVLNTEVVSALPSPIELAPSEDPVRADQVFDVTLGDGRSVRLHFEFQGRRSHRPMPLRMLDYMTRSAAPDPAILLYNVVMYVGQGAGRHDTGHHQILQPDGNPALAWNYRVLHLWNLEADDLLALERPALLALIGQTRIREPERVLPQVLARFKTVPDQEVQQRLLTAFIALINDKELLPMIEELIEDDDLFSDAPYLQHIRERCAEAREEGVEAGIEKGIEKGIILTRRLDILDAIQVRFAPPDATLQAIEETLTSIVDEATLRLLFRTALQAESLAAFQAALGSKNQEARTKNQELRTEN